MKNSMISIIIPVYNAEATLERCIQKIIEQSYPNWELLLVDDGSTDNSRVICNEASLKDKRIISIHKENGGVSSARNIGIEKASGEWITFCDSDDYVGPYWLQNFVELIGRKDSSELLFVQKINIFRQGIFDSVYYENKQGFISSSEFLLGHFGFVWNKIFKREILERHHIRFDTNIKLFEDEVFVLQYLSLMNGVFIIINDAEYNYEWPNYSHKYLQNININLSSEYEAPRNEFEEAKPLLQKVMDKEPENKTVKQALAVIAYEDNDTEKAMELLRVDDEDPVNEYYLAKCYERLGNDTKVRDSYENAVRLNPTYVQAFLSYAKYLISQEEYADAQRKLRKALKADSENIELLNLMFYVSYILVKNNVYEYNVKETLSVAEKIEKINPDLFKYPEQKQELTMLLNHAEERK